jgi:hypothetical protein
VSLTPQFLLIFQANTVDMDTAVSASGVEDFTDMGKMAAFAETSVKNPITIRLRLRLRLRLVL